MDKMRTTTGLAISLAAILFRAPVRAADPLEATTPDQPVQALRPKLLRGYLSDPASLKFRWEP